MSDKKVYTGHKGTKGSFVTRRRGNVKKRRPLNRFEAESDVPGVSASAKKLKQSDDELNIDYAAGYCILNFIMVFSTIAQYIKCKTCDADVTFEQKSARGLGFKIVIVCPNCNYVEVPSCKFINKAYEINRRIVLAMRILGIGLNGIKKFCAFMELPRPIFHSFYDKIVNLLHVASTAVRDISMKKAAEEEINESREKGEEGGITVSGDGSWRKRGFSSLYGVSSLIGWHTGKIIDVSVKCKYCKACEYWEVKKNTTEYEQWYFSHQEECQCNHEGSSGKMEVDSIVEMFARSVSLYNIKYTNYIGDGDSKTFKGIVDSHPYQTFEVKKKECVDHVQKRMGSRLRTLKKNMKGLGGKGKLTAKLIDELTIYYGLAIRRNSDSVENMKRCIWATLYHKMSTDRTPMHDTCSESWCEWKKAKAAGTLKDVQHKPSLSNEVFEAIKPIYEDLSREELLSRCLGAFTQNANESFNATVWNLAPKSYSSGKKVLDIAVSIATCNFNDGIKSILQIMKVLEIDIGAEAYNFCVETDANRIKLAERSLTGAAKAARLAVKSTRKKKKSKIWIQKGNFMDLG